MLTHRHRTVAITVWTVSLLLLAISSSLAQPVSNVTRRPSPATRNAILKNSENEAALKLLERLRAIRDCWVDPYVMLPYDEPKEKSELAFYACGSEYALRLAEARASVSDALDAIDNAAVTREATAAIAVFNDLDILQRFFNRSALSSLIQKAPVSSVYPIIHRYKLSYKENWTPKAEIYRQMMPHRRVHVDRLAALIPSVPSDPNPTLTPAQAAAATDDLTWARAVRDISYEWYLRWFPHGRHAAEARDAIARKDEIRNERNEQLEKTRRELEGTTRKVLEAYVRGDKATYGSFLSERFPSRQLFIARLKPQAEVLSFEIIDFQIERLNNGFDLYRAKMKVQYKSMLNKERGYDNSILYLKTERGWEIVEWNSHMNRTP